MFNGHQLDVGEEYCLINFAREDTEWPASVNTLGCGTVNEYGDVHIMGNYAYITLGYDTTPDSGSTSGYKIWLVKEADLNEAHDELVLWNPAEILFEYALIS
ncbi:hypothetical protein A3K63_03130 [Candidatus Micrarchaeota archaeon RBG_16_49_10]|nr:MAG: hypothetical protein A3K63_03130 [Candidatus Micrarchaeota archaeon RBG_16_49_10]